MLRITIELIPMGNEARKQTIAVMHVTNDGTGTMESGNYTVDFMEADQVVGVRTFVKSVTRDRIFHFMKDLLSKINLKVI